MRDAGRHNLIMQLLHNLKKEEKPPYNYMLSLMSLVVLIIYFLL